MPQEIRQELLDELLADYQSPEDQTGPDGLLKTLFKRLIETAGGAELEMHLGYEKGDPAGRGSGNSYNGTTPKTLKTELGEIPLDTPRGPGLDLRASDRGQGRHPLEWPPGAGEVVEADLVLPGPRLCGEDVDRAGRLGGSSSGADGAGWGVGGGSGRRDRGDTGVDRPGTGGVVVDGVVSGRASRWARVEDPGRVGPTVMVGFDETVMSPARRRRRRRFVTAVVDVRSGQILDLFDGRDARDLRAWMAAMPAEWLAGIDVVSVDPHEGYRSAVVRPDPLTGAASPLAGVTVVVDPFHVVRLANAAVVRHEAPCVRRRVRDPPL